MSVLWKKQCRRKANSEGSLNRRKVSTHKRYQWNFKSKAKEPVTWKKFSVLNYVGKSSKIFKYDSSLARSIGRTLLALPFMFFWTALAFSNFPWTVKGYIYVEVIGVHWEKVLLWPKDFIFNKWWRKCQVLQTKSACMEPDIWALLPGEFGHR